MESALGVRAAVRKGGTRFASCREKRSCRGLQQIFLILSIARGTSPNLSRPFEGRGSLINAILNGSGASADGAGSSPHVVLLLARAVASSGARNVL
jgi:hypothetical protein